MKIVNARPWPVDLPAIGATVDPGDVIDVPKALADALLNQPSNWTKPAGVKPADDKEV